MGNLRFIGMFSVALVTACGAAGSGDGAESDDAAKPSTGETDIDTDSDGAADESGDGHATGHDSGSDSEGTPVGCLADGPAFGRVYIDENGSDLSRYAGGFEEGVDTPLAGVKMQVFPDSVAPVTTCDDGRYHPKIESDGVYLIAAPDPGGACTRRDCPRRLPAAIAEGTVRILTIGDSVPVVGDPVTFPVRVADLFSELTEVEQANAAVPGSVSTDWLPGSDHFESVRGGIANTDVVVMSVGGNDVLQFVRTVDFNDLNGALGAANETVDKIVANVRAITAEIRSINSDIDVVFCLYPDYSLATKTSPWDSVSFLPPGVVTGLLARARDEINPDDDLVVVDLFEASQDLPMPLDDYLADSLHFNNAGHDLYAHEVFAALGGVLLGDSPLESAPLFENQQDYGFTP